LEDQVKEQVTIDSFASLPASTTAATDYLVVYSLVKTYTDGNASTIRIKYKGVDVENVTGGDDDMSFVDANGQPILVMAKPYAYDANGARVDLTYDIDSTTFGNLKVGVKVPYEWLWNAAYPVVIDPTWMKGPTALTGSSLRAQYHLESDGTDSSGNSYTASKFGTGTAYVAGVFGNALNITSHAGAAGMMNTTMSVYLGATGNKELSWGGWFNSKLSPASTYDVLIETSNSTGTGETYIFGNASGYYCTLYAATGNTNAYVPSARTGVGWIHLACVVNTTHIIMYANGVSVSSGTITSSVVTTTNRIHIGGFNTDSNSFFTGYIDEVQYYNRTLSAAEVLQLYQSGISEVNITAPANNTAQYTTMNVSVVIGFGDQTLASNITYTNMTGGVHVARTSAGVETNTSWFELTKLNGTHYSILDFSTKPVLNGANVSILVWGGNGLISSATQTNTFNITGGANSDITNTWLSQNPPDISSTNVINNPLVISYFANASTNSNSLVNISSVKLCFITNASTNNIFFVNGTATTNAECEVFGANDSAARTYNWTIDDNEIYPGSFALSAEGVFDSTPHTRNNLANANGMVKLTLYNISNNTAYNFFEIMVNSSGATPMSLWYCNATYTTGNPATSANCASLGTLANTATYNHYHDLSLNYSAHQVFSMGINTTSKTFNNVGVTTVGYFIAQGTNAGTWAWWSIPDIARADTTQTTVNGGVAWSNFAGTIDAHLHQYTGAELFNYYKTELNQSGAAFSSPLRTDLINLSGLPPNAPDVILPINDGQVDMNILQSTASISPNGYAISNYTWSLYNLSYSLNKTLVIGNTSAFYDFSAIPVANYILGVTVCDNLSQCATSYINTTVVHMNVTTLSPLNMSNQSNTGDVFHTLYLGQDTTYPEQFTAMTVYVYNATGTLVASTGTSFSAGNGNQTLYTNVISLGTATARRGFEVGNRIWYAEVTNAMGATHRNANMTYVSRNLSGYLIDRYPLNNSIGSTTLDFRCLFGNMSNIYSSEHIGGWVITNSSIRNVTLNVYNNTGLYYTKTTTNAASTCLHVGDCQASSSVPTQGYGANANLSFGRVEEYVFSSVPLDLGLYNWTCQECEWDDECSAFGSANFFVNISTSTAIPLSTGGSCLTETAFNYSYVGNVSDAWVLVNMSAMSTLVDDTLTGVIVSLGSGTTANSYTAGNYTIAVDTGVEHNFTVIVSGSGTVISRGTWTPATSTQIYLSAANFTQSAQAIYSVNIKDEITGTAFNLGTPNTASLTVICKNFAPDTINLKTFNKNSFILATKEPPTIVSEMGYGSGVKTRIYQPLTSIETVNIYQNYNSVTIDLVNVNILDYVGAFSGAYLQMYSNLNGSLQKIWQQQFYDLMVPNVGVVNNTYVQYVVYTPSETRVIGWDRIVNSTTKTIVLSSVTAPIPAGWSNMDVSMGFTSSYASNTVGLAYRSLENTISSVEMIVSVQNATTTEYMPLYNITVTGSQNGTISYITPDQNATYRVQGNIVSSRYGVLSSAQLMVLRLTAANLSIEYDKLGLPTSIMGIGKERLYTGLAMFLITAMAMLISPAFAGWGGIFVVIVIAVTKRLGWFREMTWTMVMFIGAMAVLYLWVSERRKSE
jgi:hypothetical protein